MKAEHAQLHKCTGNNFCGIQKQLCLFSSHVLSECVMALGAGYILLASPGSRSQWPELWMACTPVSVLVSGGIFCKIS